jgi:hypothetical protein
MRFDTPLVRVCLAKHRKMDFSTAQIGAQIVENSITSARVRLNAIVDISEFMAKTPNELPNLIQDLAMRQRSLEAKRRSLQQALRSVEVSEENIRAKLRIAQEELKAPGSLRKEANGLSNLFNSVLVCVKDFNQ